MALPSAHVIAAVRCFLLGFIIMYLVYCRYNSMCCLDSFVGTFVMGMKLWLGERKAGEMFCGKVLLGCSRLFFYCAFAVVLSPGKHVRRVAYYCLFFSYLVYCSSWGLELGGTAAWTDDFTTPVMTTHSNRCTQ